MVDARRSNPDLANLTSDLVQATPEIQVTVDPNKAIGVGITAAQVANGDPDRPRPDDRRAGHVRDRPTDGPHRHGRSGVASPPSNALRTLPVGTVAKVPLDAIATVEQADVQGSITRIDPSPSASITAEITSDDTGAISPPVVRR